MKRAQPALIEQTRDGNDCLLRHDFPPGIFWTRGR
jgi:hypothetical protein